MSFPVHVPTNATTLSVEVVTDWVNMTFRIGNRTERPSNWTMRRTLDDVFLYCYNLLVFGNKDILLGPITRVFVVTLENIPIH